MLSKPKLPRRLPPASSTGFSTAFEMKAREGPGYEVDASSPVLKLRMCLCVKSVCGPCFTTTSEYITRVHVKDSRVP